MLIFSHHNSARKREEKVKKGSYIRFYIVHLVGKLAVCLTRKKCGYISSEELPEAKAKEMVRSYLGNQNCTRGHVKLVKVRA